MNTRCQRCGGTLVRGGDRAGYFYAYCLQCGREPALSPEREAELRAHHASENRSEAQARIRDRTESSRNRAMLSAIDERNLRRLNGERR